MEPVETNTRSKRTGHPISSDDVIWPGSCCLPCFSFCDNVSLTDVVTKIGQQVCSQYNAYAPGNGSTVGQWIPFGNSVPLSGNQSGLYGGTYSYTITPNTALGGPLMYKFTPSGDLYIKGSLLINMTPTGGSTSVYDAITLVSIPLSSFPIGWNNNNSVIVSWDAVVPNSEIVYYLNLNYPTGELQLFFVNYATTSVGHGTNVSLSGVQLNLA